VVAITVVLSATVFLVVNGLGEKAERAPDVSFRSDRTSNSLTVVHSDTGVDWFVDIDVLGSCSDHALLNGGALPTGPDQAIVTAGDRLSGCLDGETLRIVASKPNQLIFETTF
jgi:hypothetical protein